jgi:transcriptional regulator with XRE-family HTH domain
LLKHWRGQRGLSQLDLALVAGVSSRHISFLETGRSNPSPEMVRRLAATLGVPLRHVNAMLKAAGHAPAHEEGEELPEAARRALALLKRHQEPFPLVVVDRAYRVRDLNQGAFALFAAMLDLPDGVGPDDVVAMGLNLAVATFDPAGAQPLLVNFDEVGRELLWRIQREMLADPEDGQVRELHDTLLAMPTVPEAWRTVDLSVPAEPALVLHLRRGDLELRFLTMVTVFQAPQNIAVEELRVETWLPCDEATAAACAAL